MGSSTKTLVQALRVLARDIESPDGVANAAIGEAADRLEELERALRGPVATKGRGRRVTFRVSVDDGYVEYAFPLRVSRQDCILTVSQAVCKRFRNQPPRLDYRGAGTGRIEA